MLAVVVFCLGTAWTLYVLFGYPLILAALAARVPARVRRAPAHPSVSIVIAVHNGEAFLESKLQSIFSLDYPKDRIQILVASDGSTDATDSIAQRYASRGVLLLRLPRGGKPAALNAAIQQATGDILVLTDVRQTLAPDSLALLMENFADPGVGAVSAELVILKANRSEEDTVSLYWRYELWIRLNLSRIDSIFGATGAYYALRRELAVPVPPDTLLDDMYLPLAAFFRGYRLIVDPRARMFDYPTGLQAEFRRKVRTLAGNYQILASYPSLLGPRNRLWLHYISYKFGRLLLPFALLLVLLSAFGLPGHWRTAAVAVQTVFYALALLDPWIPASFLKRISYPIHTFVVLMAATLCAVSVFFIPAATLWKTTTVSGFPPSTRG
jgi:poly-beta-1,6-N-acetyl-D-glucosamine synthase